MSLSLECKKAKRTGFIPAFLCGGILAAAVPIVNMAVRSEMYGRTAKLPDANSNGSKLANDGDA